MPATILNRNLLKRYEEMVLHLHAEPKGGIMMGSFIFDDIEEPEPEDNTSKKKKQKKVLLLITQVRSRDIRSMLTCLRKVQSTKKSTVDQKGSEEKSVVLDD